MLVLLPHMVCNALVAGGRLLGAEQQDMRPGRVEQIISAIKHSVASSWFSWFSKCLVKRRWRAVTFRLRVHF